uniref:Uncharacterized protein n=2 Tax=Meloidogyne enterolobii TaxID=390850 RepID=A0A6V7XFI4_MELEN|nr:unnamed protein product [Meloidogyne enterolobii]
MEFDVLCHCFTLLCYVIRLLLKSFSKCLMKYLFKIILVPSKIPQIIMNEKREIPYVNSCKCNSPKDNNCAHYLSNWLIENSKLSSNPKGSTATCSEGRVLRAKDLASGFGKNAVGFGNIFKNEMGLSMSHNPPKGDCFIYCERGGRGHVYYGTKDNCVAGTGSGKDFGAQYYQYYT